MSALSHRTKPGSARVHISVRRGRVGPVDKDSWAVEKVSRVIENCRTFGLESGAESEDFVVECWVAL